MSLIARRSPDPPRPVSLWNVATRVYTSYSSVVLVIVAVFLAIFAVVVAAAPGHAAARIATEIVVISLAAVFLLAPGVRSAKVWRALRHGVLATATVTSVEVIPRGKALESIDAYRHGLARGEMTVATRGRSLVFSFESDASWAANLTRGGVLDVLLDEAGTKLLLLLGPSGN